MKIIYANISFIAIDRCRGHHELVLSEEAFEIFQNSSLERQKEWIEEAGDLLIDDFEIDNYGEITSITIN